MLISDNDLPDFRKVKEGDPLAQRAAYSVLWGVGESACRRIAEGTGIDIGLIVQDAACETLNKACELDSWDHFRRMMAVVTRNKTIDVVRKKGTKKNGEGAHPLVLEDLLIHPSLPEYQRPDNTLMRKEMYMAILECSKLLPGKKTHDIILLRFLDEEGYADISNQMDIPQGTVGVVIMRSLEFLRDCIRKKGLAPK